MLAERFACTEMIARLVQPVNMENFMSLFTLDVIKCCKANIEKRLCMFQGVRFAAGPLLVWAAWSCVQCDQTGRGFHIVSASIWHIVVPGHSVLMPVCCVSILAQERQLDCVGTICLSVSQDPLKGIIDGHKLHVTQMSHQNLACVLWVPQKCKCFSLLAMFMCFSLSTLFLWSLSPNSPPLRCGGTVGAILTCPLEVVKTRLQSSSITLYISEVQLSTVNGASVARVAPPGPLHCLK